MFEIILKWCILGVKPRSQGADDQSADSQVSYSIQRAVDFYVARYSQGQEVHLVAQQVDSSFLVARPSYDLSPHNFI